MSLAAVRTVPWKGPALVCAVLVAALLVYWPATISLAELWSDARGETYTSGFLIAAISLWLMWRARRDFVYVAPPQAAWRWLALAFLAGTALVWQFALRAGIQLGYLTLLPVLLWTCVLLVCGVRAARAAAFPLGYLIFALPVWDHAISLLQWLTIQVVRLTLRATGVPSYFSGDLVQIPAGVFEIQGGCSGLNYLIVGLAIGTLLGELRHDDMRARLRWLLVMGALSIVSNWVRVYTIILAGHLSHMQSYLVRVSHYSYGWVIFMVALLLFFAYVRYRAKPPRAHLGKPAAAPPDPVLSQMRAGWLTGVLAAAAFPAAMNLIVGSRLPAVDAGLMAPGKAAEFHGWRAGPASGSSWQPLQPNADREQHLRFARGSEVVELFVADYAEQRQRRKLGGRASYPGGLGVEVVDENLAQAAGKTFATQQLEHDGMRVSLWRVYQVGDRWFTSATRAQFWYSAQTFVTLRSLPSRVWLLRSECAMDCAAADARLVRFVEENRGILWPEAP
jgi:exosortase A